MPQNLEIKDKNPSSGGIKIAFVTLGKNMKERKKLDI